MKKIILTAVLALSLVMPSQQAFAGILGDRFHFGLSGGLGFGKLSDSTTTGETEDFGTISWMAHAGVRFTPSLQLRLSLGLDDYFNFASSSDTRDVASDDGLLFAGDIDLLWHPLKGKLPLFDPYLLGGVGYPRYVHGGFGTDVSLGGTFGLFGEVLYGTAFVDQRGLARIGVKVKF